MIPPKVYIAGSYSKHWEVDAEGCKAKFLAAKEKLIALGYEAVSPIDFGLPEGANWKESKDVCLEKLKECDILFMLKDWRESEGAKAEQKEWLKLMTMAGKKYIEFEEKKGYEFLAFNYVHYCNHAKIDYTVSTV
jgi:hypothetical protein